VRGLNGSSAVDSSKAYTRLDGPRTDVGDTAVFRLNRYGAPRAITDALGNVTHLYRGDSRWPGLVTLQVSANGRRESATYDARGNLLAATDSSTSRNGVYATTQYQWDASCDEVTRVTTPEGEVTDISHDPATCNRLWQQDSRGATSRVNFTYYTSGAWVNRLHTVKAPLTPATTVTYDDYGNVRSATSPRGFTSTSYKDALGRDTLVVSPIDTTGTQLQRTRTVYDVMGRLDSTVSAAVSDSVIVWHTYDDEDNVRATARRVVPDVASIGTSTTQWRYDAAGQRVAEVATDGYVDSTAYDLAGNVVAAVTRRGHTVRMQYDALNRLTTRWVPDVAKLDTTVSFDPTTIDDWHFPLHTLPTFADTATFTYDELGNLRTARNRDASVKRTYNVNGTLQTDTLRIRTYADLSVGGDTTSHVYGLRHGYDLAGRRVYTLVPRQLGASFAAAPTVVYDSMAYSYTGFGALKIARDVLGNVFEYQYDLNGRVSKLLYPLGDFKQYTYDADDNATTIQEDRTASGNQSKNNLIQARRDARGKMVELNPNSQSWGWQPFAYRGLGAMSASAQKSLVYNQSGGPRNTGTWYDVDPIGNARTSQSTYTYSYYAGQLNCEYSTEYSVSGQSIRHHSYAPATGRLLTTGDTTGESQVATPSSCYSQTSGGTKLTSYQYDRAGNQYWSASTSRDSSTYQCCSWQTTRVLLSRTARYYDAGGHLRALDDRSNGGGTFEEYRYDALGRRVLRRSRQTPNSDGPDVIQRFVWDDDHLIAEVQYPGNDDATSTQLERDTVTLASSSSQYFGRVLYLGGESTDLPLSIVRVGYRNSVGGTDKGWDPLAMSPRWDIQGRGYDHAFYGATPVCKTVNGETKCAGIHWVARDAYGLSLNTNASYTAWWGSLAQDQSDRSGQLYRRNRYYDPATGRFTQEDPIGLAGGLNAYGFADGDPVNFSDPFGLNPIAIAAAAMNAARAICGTPGGMRVCAAAGAAVAKYATPVIQRGMHNPKVRSAVAFGLEVHKQFKEGMRAAGHQAEIALVQASKVIGRIDGMVVDAQNKVLKLYDLKPDNPRAIAEGVKQLNFYTREVLQRINSGHPDWVQYQGYTITTQVIPYK
jgi:RHS repeat-associated protein